VEDEAADHPLAVFPLKAGEVSGITARHLCVGRILCLFTAWMMIIHGMNSYQLRQAGWQALQGYRTGYGVSICAQAGQDAGAMRGAHKGEGLSLL